MTYKTGIDLGGTKTEILVLDTQYKPVYRERVATPARDYRDIVETIGQLVQRAETGLGVTCSVGIGVPGAISPKSGLLRNANTVCLNDQPLQRDLEIRLQREVRIENDANCFVLSEALGGVAQGYPIVFGVIIGTGTGGGLVVNGKLVNGPHSITGEWGHNPLPWRRDEDGSPDCYCGKKGCIETYLSGPGLSSNFRTRFGESCSSEEIIAAAAADESNASAMMEIYFDQMARALAHVINIIDPHVIVLGGGMSNIDAIYQNLHQGLALYVFSDYVETPIVRAEHGDASGVFGAAMLWQ
jgi:fructokinase